MEWLISGVETQFATADMIINLYNPASLLNSIKCELSDLFQQPNKWTTQSPIKTDPRVENTFSIALRPSYSQKPKGKNR